MSNNPEQLDPRVDPSDLVWPALLFLYAESNIAFPITRDVFLRAWRLRTPPWRETTGTELLDELQRRGFVEINSDGAISITRKGRDASVDPRLLEPPS